MWRLGSHFHFKAKLLKLTVRETGLPPLVSVVWLMPLSKNAEEAQFLPLRGRWVCKRPHLRRKMGCMTKDSKVHLQHNEHSCCSLFFFLWNVPQEIFLSSFMMSNLTNLPIFHVCKPGHHFLLWPSLVSLCLGLHVNLPGCYSIEFLTEALYSRGCKSLVQNSHYTLWLLLHPFLVFDKCNVTHLHSCCCTDHFPSLTSCPETSVFTSHHCHLLLYHIKYSNVSLTLRSPVHANIWNPTFSLAGDVKILLSFASINFSNASHQIWEEPWKLSQSAP